MWRGSSDRERQRWIVTQGQTHQPPAYGLGLGTNKLARPNARRLAAGPGPGHTPRGTGPPWTTGGRDSGLLAGCRGVLVGGGSASTSRSADSSTPRHATSPLPHATLAASRPHAPPPGPCTPQAVAPPPSRDVRDWDYAARRMGAHWISAPPGLHARPIRRAGRPGSLTCSRSRPLA